MRALTRIVFAWLLCACSFTRDPVSIEGSETQFGVFSLLVSGADSASVLVVRFPPAPSVLHPGWEGVGGATVAIVAGADTIPLTELPPDDRGCASGMAGDRPPGSSGCYRGLVPGGIRAGSSYALLADVPGFGRVNGLARVPFPPEVLAPAEGERLSADAVNGAWPRVLIRLQPGAGTQRIEATLTTPQDPTRTCEAGFQGGERGAQGLIVLDLREADSVSVPFSAACFTSTGRAPVGEMPGVLRFLAVDSAFVRYAEAALENDNEALLSSHTRAGIDRGIGFFAGAAVAERRVVLTGS